MIPERLLGLLWNEVKSFELNMLVMLLNIVLFSSYLLMRAHLIVVQHIVGGLGQFEVIVQSEKPFSFVEIGKYMGVQHTGLQLIELDTQFFQHYL